ncbi:monofunctional biosynthetic peptidoglycan transglycosylase [Testudinibacter sp. TR-2022]|uniref:monofunctional biosynthetic peptidoglycan transglycosylase n=1 Tax=Testudinibacter sp. TR-2022 TaxID=2585029 RepID=UPI0011195A3F|nr:monofunctional biosynthetic peptidoglycan transglycosylase [Testudinibacter sp. TR-2022]TNH03847.1 monofunctional biosynthetic peptidoglycan transglycosylase [Pasteurellaceae bacterium Phil31]TNH10450.1 monofunctional biosynthetic peptidoglycan transglycosylase [Testudinibacter sp. TR-2022]TNH10686.1 monofunctional biosynthetic peptidoglycan transglycosylase [Testudinibacter sp. TR-2022]TNH11350.1 monofunctional biosynthetic peptidoglycan transglycosylase [Testudinibacter sp. TR-2022]TNH194
MAKYFRTKRFFSGRKCGWRRNTARFLCKWLVRGLAAIVLLTALLRVVPVPFSAYMLQQKLGHWFSADFSYELHYDWVSLDNISWQMQLAVIAAEDQRFDQHFGLDFEAIQLALDYNARSNRTRGASTISQQTAKNLYLWHGQSWLRKGIEVPTTLMLELLWDKRRILQVYLNIAEFGDGIFGVEAAAQHYFKKSAARLNASEAALLAAVLPNPILYRADKPSAAVLRKQQWIIQQMNALGGRAFLQKLE